MKRTGTAAIALAISLIATLTGGCAMWGGPTVDTKEATRQGIAYMENRYGVKFTLIGIQGGGADGTNMSRPVLHLTTPYVSDPNTRIRLRANPDNGDFTFSGDDFLYYKFAQDAQDQAMPVVTTLLATSTVRVAVEMFGDRSYPDSFSGQTSGEDFFSFLRRHAAGYDAFSNGRPLAEFRVLTVDDGQDLEDVATRIVPALVQATGWGISGRFNVPCSLDIEAYSTDDYRTWVDFFSKQKGEGNYTPHVHPSDKVSVEF